MLLKNVKNLLAVLALGFLVVGCGSNQPVDEEEVAAAETATKESMTSTAATEDAGRLAEIIAAIEGQKVFFEFDRSDVQSANFDLIKLHAEYLSLNTEAKVTIEGHCDERGTREYNLALGERRAMAVKNALISQGISADRVDVISFGEDRPAVADSNEEAWAQNRRAEFKY